MNAKIVTIIGVCVGIALFVFVLPVAGLVIIAGFLCRNIKASVLAGFMVGLVYGCYVYYAIIFSRNGHSLHLLTHSYVPVYFAFCVIGIPVVNFIKVKIVRILNKQTANKAPAA